MTERKLTEEASRESEELFRRIAEENPDVFFVVDHKNYNVLYVNPVYEEIWGRTCESLYQEPRSWLDAIFSEDRERVDAALEEQQRTGEFCEEFRITRPDGSVRWIYDRIFPIRDSRGEVYRLVGIAQDITERKRTEKALQYYESMVTATSDLMVLVDSTYKYRAMNQAYRDQHRRTQEEILGHTVTEVFGEKTFEEKLKPTLDRCLTGEQVKFEVWWDVPRWGRRHLDVRYDPFYETDGSVSGVAVAVRDTTERKHIEQQLEHSVAALEAANRELELFSASLSHDLKSPLMIVTNFSHHLHEALGDSLGEQEDEDLQRIRAAGRHMTDIIDDLRGLADVNRVEISREEVDLSSLGQEIIDELRALVPDRDVAFEAEAEIQALGDKTLLRILLTNLLQNAWKYTGRSDDARIELGVEEDESDGPTYHVRDNGIGFDNADCERIFRAFERLQSRRDFPGTGLGLATVERIVHRHDGRVWAEGVPGEGAIFRFTLGPPPTERRGARRPRLDG